MLMAKRTRQGFTNDQAARLLKLRPHQIADLVDRGFLKPSVWRGRRGPKGGRLFSSQDLVAIRSAHELIRLGVVGNRLRRVCRKIRDVERRGFRQAVLLISYAGEILHVPNRARLLALLKNQRRPAGQIVLDLGRLSDEVQRTLVRTQR
jgi:hypothetical protein